MDDQIVDIIELDLGGNRRMVYEIKRPKFTPEGVEVKPSTIRIDISLDAEKKILVKGDWNGESIDCIAGSLEDPK